MLSTEAAFTPVREALEKSNVRYAIGGSWASTAYGEPRFTNDVDILADFTPSTLSCFFANLPDTFFADAEEAQNAIRIGRPFNVIYMPMAFKFDLFAASAFLLGAEELDRAIRIPCSGLSDSPIPFVSPEDILLAKLDWYRKGGEVSEVQWRDIAGIVRGRRDTLDRRYLEKGASKLLVVDLLERALRSHPSPIR